MTPSTCITDGGWDFLQHNPLIESYICAPVLSHFIHLKIETYDGSTDPIQHMIRFTSKMYVYNALDNTCCRIFLSSLNRKSLAWYIHLPPRNITSFKDLGEKFIQNFPNPFFNLLQIFSLVFTSDHHNLCWILLPDSTRQLKKFPIYPKENISKLIEID